MIGQSQPTSSRSFLNETLFSVCTFACIYWVAGVAWPGFSRIGWVVVGFLASVGMTMCTQKMQYGSQKTNQPRDTRKRIEIGIWLLVCLACLGLAGWRLVGLTWQIVFALALFSVSSGLLWQRNLATGIIQGLATSSRLWLGWAALRGSLFTDADWPVWILTIFLVLWYVGKVFQVSGTDEEQNLSQKWAHINQLMALAPLFFLGQLLKFGFIYGLAVFSIFLITEARYRMLRQAGVINHSRLAWMDVGVGGLLLAGCIGGGWM